MYQMTQEFKSSPPFLSFFSSLFSSGFLSSDFDSDFDLDLLRLAPSSFDFLPPFLFPIAYGNSTRQKQIQCYFESNYLPCFAS